MAPAENELCCTLTSPELQERKNTVITELKKAVMDKQDVQDSFVYAFSGSDRMLDQLMAFIQSESSFTPRAADGNPR